MGKPTGRKNKAEASKKTDAQSKQNKVSERSSKSFDEDTAVFITMSQELKEEGNKLFQKRDHEGAMLKYEKALKLLPQNHIDVASLRTNMAACYIQMGIGEYPRAINECNLALEVAPKYSKALLKRARCFEALNRLDLAWRDVRVVLNIEPNNLTALEIRDSLKKAMEEKGIMVDENEITSASASVAPVTATPSRKLLNSKKVMKDKAKRKKRSIRVEKESEQGDEELVDDKSKPEDKEVVQEAATIKEEKVVSRTVKLVLGDDIRWAQLPFNCSVLLMRDVVRDRFPNLRGALIKYRDQEGDLITITTTDELRKAEASADLQGNLRLYVAEVNPDQEPVYEGKDGEINKNESLRDDDMKKKKAGNGDNRDSGLACLDNWIIQFAQLFKNHVGFDSDGYLDLHGIGMKLYSEAIEDTVTSDEAQELFDIASEKFQEMAALALFNWGNVHMSKARKRVFPQEDDAGGSMQSPIKIAYEWAQMEYKKAGMRYEEALKIKPDFYEGFLALGQQQFEQAKLSWHYAIGSKVGLAGGVSQEVLQLYNKAEDSMEAGMQIWEEMEERRLNGLSKEDKDKSRLQKMGLDDLLKDISADEASEQAAIMRSQIYILWATLLYERSIVEFKLGLPTWEECLEVAVEKFELSGASHADIGVLIKNHCSNKTAPEGLGFKIDEIVQAWHEMYDAKRWQLGIPSFRLEPLFRQCLPRLNYLLEHV
ncbi:hypothetical protein Ancab_023206 [Ancistrocladus abbreviatus]